MNDQEGIHILARALIVDRGYVLLCQTDHLPNNFYFLPGGHIKPKESAIQTVHREVLEEIGIKCNVQNFLGCVEYRFEPTHTTICHHHEYNLVFLVDPIELNAPNPIESPETQTHLVWIKIEDLASLNVKPEGLASAIPMWLSKPPPTNAYMHG